MTKRYMHTLMSTNRFRKKKTMEFVGLVACNFSEWFDHEELSRWIWRGSKVKGRLSWSNLVDPCWLHWNTNFKGIVLMSAWGHLSFDRIYPPEEHQPGELMNELHYLVLRWIPREFNDATVGVSNFPLFFYLFFQLYEKEINQLNWEQIKLEKRSFWWSSSAFSWMQTPS